jgi:hypothetical protein
MSPKRPRVEGCGTQEKARSPEMVIGLEQCLAPSRPLVRWA